MAHLSVQSLSVQKLAVVANGYYIWKVLYIAERSVPISIRVNDAIIRPSISTPKTSLISMNKFVIDRDKRYGTYQTSEKSNQDRTFPHSESPSSHQDWRASPRKS